jgi:hypothetical protein
VPLTLDKYGCWSTSSLSFISRLGHFLPFRDSVLSSHSVSHYEKHLRLTAPSSISDMIVCFIQNMTLSNALAGRFYDEEDDSAGDQSN